MNSLFHGRMLQQTKHQICSLMKCKKAKIVVIAFVRFVTHYKKYPINITFKQSLRRNHAMEALERNKLELFPIMKGMPIEPVEARKRK